MQWLAMHPRWPAVQYGWGLVDSGLQWSSLLDCWPSVAWQVTDSDTHCNFEPVVPLIN